MSLQNKGPKLQSLTYCLQFLGGNGSFGIKTGPWLSIYIYVTSYAELKFLQNSTTFLLKRLTLVRILSWGQNFFLYASEWVKGMRSHFLTLHTSVGNILPTLLSVFCKLCKSLKSHKGRPRLMLNYHLSESKAFIAFWTRNTYSRWLCCAIF